MATLAQLKESVEAVSFTNKKGEHEHEHRTSQVRKAISGDKKLSDTDMKPDMKHTTYEAAEDSEEQKQREHDALVAQEKGELGKLGIGRFRKVRQWYGKVSLKRLKAMAAKEVEKSDDKDSDEKQQ